MENEIQKQALSATEETTPVAFSDWTQKLRFDRSFSAKLILSDEKVKEYYADIVTELLRYEKVNSRTSWAGVSFSVGKKRIAAIAITGKTLCLYLALDPDSAAEGKYKVKDVGEVKVRSSTPSMLKIRSDGAKRHAIRLIGETAEKWGLALKSEEGIPISAANFKADSFNNLVTRGLIRVLKNSRKTEALDAEAAVEDVISETSDGGAEAYNDKSCGAYDDTVFSIESLLGRHGIYNEILGSFAEGDGKIKLSEKHMLRSVDEIWVKAIEDCLSSLDELIRNPNHFIAETEEVLPIELTKKITGRSIAHLGRHTDYIHPDDSGDITPTKMLNVFREDSLLTYENKFLNTLINRLYMFVSKRYRVAKEYGTDEKLESFEFENCFSHGEGKGRIRISIEYSERELDADAKNKMTGTGLWNRVERLNDIVTGYINSSFVKSMDRNFVRPPIMRTNAIIKNKYFRECLALWEFIESYDDAGYGITIDEKIKDISEEHIKEIYADAAMQYLVFRHHIDSGFGEEISETFSVVPDYAVEKSVLPDNYSEEFVYPKSEEEISDANITAALRTALMADDMSGDEENASGDAVIYSKTFHAKLRLSGDEVKENFAEISNGLLKYDGVKMRHSRLFSTYNKGRNILARINVSGKTIKLYLALPIDDIPEKYNASDVSDKSKFAATPSCVKVRSKRSVKYALELISILAEKFALKLSEKPVTEIKASDYTEEPIAEMILKGWVIPSKRSGRTPLSGDWSSSFGPSKRERANAMARETERLSVSEPPKPAEILKTEEAEKPTSDISEEGRRSAEAIDNIIRPDSNYSKPTEFGIDDSAGFIKDEETVSSDNPKKEEPESDVATEHIANKKATEQKQASPRKGFMERLFGKRNSDKK